MNHQKKIKIPSVVKKHQKSILKYWDPDYTKLTPKEKIQLEKSQNEGYISFDEIDWD